MKKLKSIVIALWIHIDRIIDHGYRMLTGKPTVRRSQIMPSLYIGGQYKESGLKHFGGLGITAVVNMRMKADFSVEQMKPIRLLHLPTIDQTAPTIEQLQKGIRFIQDEIDNGGKVYIHCRFGEGRGPTMGIAYLLSIGMTFEDALALVKENRPFVNLTKPQKKRLQELYNTCYKED